MLQKQSVQKAILNIVGLLICNHNTIKVMNENIFAVVLLIYFCEREQVRYIYVSFQKS